MDDLAGFSCAENLLGFHYSAPPNSAQLPFLLHPTRMGCTHCDSDFQVTRGRDYPHLALHIVFSGCSFFRLEGREYLLKKGDAFFILSNQEHQYCNAEQAPLAYLWIELETCNCHDILQWLRLQDAPVLDAAHTAPLFASLVQMVRYVKQNASPDACQLSGMCYLLLMQLCSAKASLPNAHALPDCVRAALYYIAQHFAESPSVGTLAAYANVSESCLSKCFRGSIGTSPARYLLLKKTEHAIFLLKSTPLTCEKIAEQCGFYDATHLSKVLSHQVGSSPTALRSAVKEREASKTVQEDNRANFTH